MILYESEIEQRALDLLRDLNGYQVAYGPQMVDINSKPPVGAGSEPARTPIYYAWLEPARTPMNYAWLEPARTPIYYAWLEPARTPTHTPNHTPANGQRNYVPK